MSGERSDRQAARNETVFREANELLVARKRELGADIGLTPFLCECERESCTSIVRLSDDEYGRARANPRTFLLLPGHEEGLNQAHVRERDERFVIVEKVGEMGELTGEEDARRARD